MLKITSLNRMISWKFEKLIDENVSFRKCIHITVVKKPTVSNQTLIKLSGVLIYL